MKWFWKLFSFFGRIFGWGAMIIGGIVAITYIPRLVDPNGTINVNGIEETDLFYKVVAVLFPLLIAVAGGFMIRTKPYHPFTKPEDDN
jgi:hypothetical protein